MPVVQRVSGGIGRRSRRKFSAPRSSKSAKAVTVSKAKACTWKCATVSLWTRQLLGKEYSERLGYKLGVEPIVRERAFQKTIGGPGYYDIPVNTFKKSQMPEGKAFGTSKRAVLTKNDNPAPGTYLPDIFQYSSVVKKSLTKTPPFEWSGFKDRFKPDIDETWKPSATRYCPKDIEGIDALLKKRVSRRGPYDMFTGPRDDTTIKNHFTETLAKQSVDKFYDHLGDIDYLLKHPTKKRCGVVYRESRRGTKDYLIKREERRQTTTSIVAKPPAPVSYNLTTHTIKRLPQGKVPFNVKAVTTTTAETCAPGPGRYFWDAVKPFVKRRKSLIYRNMMKQVEKKEKSKQKRTFEYTTELGLRTAGEEVDTKKQSRRSKYQKTHLNYINNTIINTASSKKEWPTLRRPFKYFNWRVVPISIETVLYEHPAVRDVIIVGFPEELTDDNPFAFVNVCEDYEGKITESDLLDFLNQKLAYREKILGGIKIINSTSPKLVSGKSKSVLTGVLAEIRY